MVRTETPHVTRHKQRMAERNRRKPRRLSSEERKAIGRQSAMTKELIQKDVQQEWLRQDQRASELAIKHRKKLSWMKTRLQRLPKYGQKRRAINKWNALIHMQSLQINEGLPMGEKKRLQDLQHIAQSAKACDDISESDLEAMKKCLEEVREHRATGVRTQKMARSQDISATSQMIQDELKNLDVRCQMSSFFITARRTTNYMNPPQYYVHSTAKEFIEHILGLTVEDLCMRYDGFCVAGVKGIAKNDNSRRSELKQRIREIILNNLRKATDEPKATMQWERYEDLVVNKYSVVLEGWPEDVTFNPSSLTLRELQLVLALLVKGKCVWKNLTPEELDERRLEYTDKLANGEIQVKKRKQRSDAGKKKGKAVSNSGGDNPDDNGGEESRDDGQRKGIHRNRPSSDNCESGEGLDD